MYYHAKSNFFQFMWQNTTFLMLFLVVLTSASKLEHFTNIFKEEDAPFGFVGVQEQYFFYPFDLNQAADGCSEMCYSSKYFCDLFILVEAPTGPMGHHCYMFNTRVSSLAHSSLPTGYATKAIYELSERDHIERLEERFSPDNGVRNLETGYFPRLSGIQQIILAASTEAMNSEPATAIDFDKWVSSRDISQSRRMPFEVQEFTGWKIMEAVRAWEKSSNVDNQESANYFDTLLLTFLDIFCPFIHEDITTIYDPVKKVISITKEDLSMLVVSYGPGDFAVVLSKDNLQWSEGNPLVFLSNSVRQGRNTPGDPVQLFEQATGKLFPTVFYRDIPVNRQNESVMPHVLHVLHIVLMSLSYDHPSHFIPTFKGYESRGSNVIFYHDLITAVLSSVYKDYERHPLFTNLKTMQTGNVYGDISVSTFHKSEQL